MEEAADLITPEEIRRMGERANRVCIEIVEDEDDDGQLFHVRLFFGGPTGRPAFEVSCRRFDLRQITKEEASLLAQELKRQENLSQIDEIMAEP